MSVTPVLLINMEFWQYRVLQWVQSSVIFWGSGGGTAWVPSRSNRVGDYQVTDETNRGQRTPYVMTIPAAGRKYFDVGRSASYEAARRGEIPTIRIGRKLLVPIAAVERLLEQAAA